MDTNEEYKSGDIQGITSSYYYILAKYDVTTRTKPRDAKPYCKYAMITLMMD